ncbi:MAG: hypothetical protein IPO41_01720 [Acidobacteria bacterium]|jgi:hypothetical protein|nr:hypothetical protein [Acidobacteriota bacterium]MBP7473960.1 hypothetical protein [Pyrinomonadaceae bacterium]MBP9109992.1 hypothetical protein [Pyrinomonadaceae bacterium]
MSGISIVSGILLVVIGIAGYIYGMNAGNASVTALIPAFFGIVLIACGAIGTVAEGMRKHLMHLAVVVALLGFILTAGRLVMKAATGGLEASPAVMSQGAMAAVCLFFVVLAIRSFAAARSARAD